MVSSTYSNLIRCLDNGKSTSENIVMLVKGVTWKSEKHTLVAFSTIHIEFVSCFVVVSHAILLKNSVTISYCAKVVQHVLCVFLISVKNWMTKEPKCNNREGTKIMQLELGDQNCTIIVSNGPKIYLSLTISILNHIWNQINVNLSSANYAYKRKFHFS